MRLPFAVLALAAHLFTLISPTDGILVSEGSQCAVKCGNVGESTASEDLSCGDGTHSAFPGLTQKECIQCELNSTHVAPNGVSDLQAMIYNLKYTAGYCIFNHSTVSSTPCITEFACGHFLRDLDHESLPLPKGSTGYDYCDDWEDSLIFRCQSCLMELGSQLTLINHMTTLLAACKQRPKNGEQIVINGDIFSGNVVSVGDPNAAANTSTFTPKEGLTLGAIIGIAVGGVVVLLVALGCCIVWRGKKRRRAVLASYSEKKYTADGHMQQVMRWQTGPKGLGIQSGSVREVYDDPLDDSPASMSSNAFIAKSSNGWPGGSSNVSEAAISPQSPAGSQHFSPYISHHASPMETMPVNGQWAAVPIPKAYRRGSVGTMTGRVDETDQIEMGPMSPEDREKWAKEASQVGFSPAPAATATFVPPTAPKLGHPGHGRTVSVESIGEAL